MQFNKYIHTYIHTYIHQEYVQCALPSRTKTPGKANVTQHSTIISTVTSLEQYNSFYNNARISKYPLPPSTSPAASTSSLYPRLTQSKCTPAICSGCSTRRELARGFPSLAFRPDVSNKKKAKFTTLTLLLLPSGPDQCRKGRKNATEKAFEDE